MACKCTNTILNAQGKRVNCSFFSVPKQPPVPGPQLAAIEAQRKADHAVHAAEKAKHEAEKARRDAEAHPADAEVQLMAVEATRAAAMAEEQAQTALDALREGDKTGWGKDRKNTPPPQVSMSLMRCMDVGAHGHPARLRRRV